MLNKLISFILAKFNIGDIAELINKNFLLKIPYKIISQKMISYDFPRHIFIETTSTCNLKCKICPRNHGKTLIGHMDFQLFKKIIDEAKKYGPRTFSLHLFGEPLLTPNFPKIIKYIKQADKNNTILLTTNGTLLNQEIGQALVKTQVDKISISFVSAEKNNYHQLTGMDKLETIEENIINLIELKKIHQNKQPIIYVRMIINKDNKNEEELFRNKWKNKPVIIETRLAHNYGGNIKNTSLRRKTTKKIKRYPCYHFWLSPAIHWNGDFSICCNDWGRKAVLGNIQNQTVKQLWNSEKIKQYRQNQLKNNHKIPSICTNCDVWTMYPDIFFKHQKR